MVWFPEFERNIKSQDAKGTTFGWDKCDPHQSQQTPLMIFPKEPTSRKQQKWWPGLTWTLPLNQKHPARHGGFLVDRHGCWQRDWLGVDKHRLPDFEQTYIERQGPFKGWNYRQALKHKCFFLDLVAGSDWIPFQESRVFHTHTTCRSPSVSYIYSQLDVVFVFNLI